VGSTINDTLISPQDFSTLPIGEPVSSIRVFNVHFSCTFPGGAPKRAGIGSMPTAGVTAVVVPGESNIFTTPQLSPLGLGYKFYWYTDQGIYGSNENFCGPNWMTSATATGAPGCYINMGMTSGTQTKQFVGELRLQFYKIGPIQDTGGATITLPNPPHHRRGNPISHRSVGPAQRQRNPSGHMEHPDPDPDHCGARVYSAGGSNHQFRHLHRACLNHAGAGARLIHLLRERSALRLSL